MANHPRDLQSGRINSQKKEKKEKVGRQSLKFGWVAMKQKKKAIEDVQTNVFNLFMTSALEIEKALKGQEIVGARILPPFLSTRAL